MANTAQVHTSPPVTIESDKDTSFRHLVESNHRRIYALAFDLTGNHPDADDLAQEVFMKVFEKYSSFKGESAVFSWMYRITVNTYLNEKKKKSRWAFLGLDKADALLSPEPAADRRMGSDQTQHIIETALGSLSPRERTAFVLKNYHDMPVNEVAAAMAVADGTVKSLLHRSSKKLQKKLQNYRQDLG